MQSAPLLEIIGRLEGLEVDDQARAVFRALVLEVGTAHGVKSIGRREQIEYARRLMALRTSRPTIRDRLMARYEISARQAYRVIKDALPGPRR